VNNQLLLVGNDKIGRKFLRSIDSDKYHIVLDNSSNHLRIIKLIKRKSISLQLLLKMFVANIFRKDYRLTNKFESIANNIELLGIIRRYDIKKIVIFRGGLIVNKKILGLGIEVLNIHCAKLPEYGGIGVIDRALKDKAYQQEATLHKIVTRIDGGEVLSTEPYTLMPNRSYLFNENIAYDAGIRLFLNLFTGFK